MESPQKIYEICNKLINVNEQKPKNQNYYNERLLDLLPKISLYFDIPKDKAEEYIKKNGTKSIRNQIANSIGDNFAITETKFGSLFMQIVMLGPKSKEKINNFLQNKEWDEQGLKEVKEKLQKTMIDFDFQTVKPKYAEIYYPYRYTQEETEKMIKEVLELSERKSDYECSTENEDNYSTKTADQIIEILTKIAHEKEIQETTLIELKEGLELKEPFVKTNNFLEQKLKESILEFRVVGLNIVNNINSFLYLDRKSKCPNCKSLILIQGTKTKHAANSVSYNFVTGRDNWYGIGTNFTDQLDYATYYAGEKKTYGDIPKIGETFPIVGAEVFYDKTKFKQIYDYSYHKDFYELWDLPTEEDVQANIDKTVEKNGIHFIEVEGEATQVITKDRKILLKHDDSTIPPIPKHLYIGREYVVTDKTQILPLFALTMKRVEYCIIWRDDGFTDDTNKKCLEERKKWIKEMTDFNLYIETSTEDALRLICQKKYNKIILITNVGNNLEGKKYIDEARKILEFNAVVLFFRKAHRHLEWIKEYQNSLFTDSTGIFERYVMSFGQGPFKEEENLNKLKSEIEQHYNTKLQNLVNPVKYPLFEKGNNACFYGQLDCSPFKG